MKSRPVYSLWAVEELPSRRTIDYAAAAPTPQVDAGTVDLSDGDYHPTPSVEYRQPVATVNRQPFRRRHNLHLLGV